MTVLTDIRFALAVFRRRPLVPLLTAGLLALSVGLAGGLWAVVDAVALRPLPYPEAAQLVAVMESHPERGLMSVTAANFWEWTPRVQTLRHVVGLGSLEASLSGHGEPVRVVGTKVTDGFFDVMGVAPAIGRAFDDADFRVERGVAIISDALWTRQFGARRNAVGTVILLDGLPHTLVGVMPRSFKTVGNSDVWVPWPMTAQERAERRFHMVGVMARLQTGRSAGDAEQELRSLYRQLAIDHPDTTARWTARVIPLRELLLGDSRRALQALGGAVAALLVVAGVNLVGLTLTWVRARRQELRIRMALGASAGRVSRQLLTEAAVWALGATIVGTWLAAAFVQFFGAVGLSPALEFDFEPRLNLRVVMAMSALLATLIAGTTAIPAWLAARRAASLMTSRGTLPSRWVARVSLAVQVALSLILLSTAATVLSGFQRVGHRAGTSRPDVLAVGISLAEARYPDETSQARYFARLVDALATRPEIASVGAASYVPPGRVFGNVRFSIDGQGPPPDEQTTLVSAVDPRTFSLLGLGVQRGRLLDDRDSNEALRVAVISATLARRYWPGADPIGRRVTMAGDDTPHTVVGIVDDARQPLATDPRAESVLYVSFRQVPWPFMTLLIAPRSDVAPAIAALREEAARLDPAQALSAARPVDEIRQEWMTQPRLRSSIVGVFGLSAWVLMLVGLWARVSWGVAARTSEWAVRQAVGAPPGAVVLTAVGEALAAVAVGVGLGVALLPLSAAAARAIVAGLPAADVWVPALATLLLVSGAVVSAYLPARRAGRVDPALALRSE